MGGGCGGRHCHRYRGVTADSRGRPGPVHGPAATHSALHFPRHWQGSAVLGGVSFSAPSPTTTTPPLGLRGAFRGLHLTPGGRKPSAAVAVKTDVPVPFLCHFKTRASHRSLNGSVESLTTFCRCELGFGGLVVPYAVDEAAEPEATKAPPANQRPGCEGGRRQCCFHFFSFFFCLFYSFVFSFYFEKSPHFSRQCS